MRLILVFISLFLTFNYLNTAYASSSNEYLITQEDEPNVKMSKSKICHAKGTRYYAQTKHYKSFKTLKACLAAGGRLPKRT